ncbi:Apc13p-domain-containing protein [Delitschia confertaspora ATCC 74209]|uniref:Apc13p-domain-containing protein n=1 Tax=Delitschia confertaspora ATCC 74209 TaxID=1513339 RepID=A0A9P4JHZ6_9PLEO|nr:Apc13p-domain-containing protein [Delitschia confertaspora ATCC 74209]
MTRDSSATYLHLHTPRIADLFEEFTRSRLSPEEIYVPPSQEPVNPEDEDDVVPDQHAAFGITRATMGKKEPAWRDLGLEELVTRGPTTGGAGVVLRRKKVGAGTGVGLAGGAGAGTGAGSGQGSGMPR